MLCLGLDYSTISPSCNLASCCMPGIPGACPAPSRIRLRSQETQIQMPMTWGYCRWRFRPEQRVPALFLETMRGCRRVDSRAPAVDVGNSQQTARGGRAHADVIGTRVPFLGGSVSAFLPSVSTLPRSHGTSTTTRLDPQDAEPAAIPRGSTDPAVASVVGDVDVCRSGCATKDHVLAGTGRTERPWSWPGTRLPHRDAV